MQTIQLGTIGAALVLVAYLPQVWHLVRSRCSVGISIAAFWVWLVGYALLTVYALGLKDITFITLQIGHLILTTTILLFAFRYRGKVCTKHQQQML